MAAKEREKKYSISFALILIKQDVKDFRRGNLVFHKGVNE